MTRKEAVSEVDRVKILEDFEPGDIVNIRLITKEMRVGELLKCWDSSVSGILIGEVIESDEGMLSVELDWGVLTFGPNTEPPISVALPNIWHIPDLSGIKVGSVLSYIMETEEGEFFRQYAEVTEADWKSSELSLLRLFILNPTDDHDTISFYPDDRWSIPQQMLGWQIED